MIPDYFVVTINDQRIRCESPSDIKDEIEFRTWNMNAGQTLTVTITAMAGEEEPEGASR